MSLRLDGRVALVTGAGQGLGRAYARQLAEMGAKVVVNDLGHTDAGESASRAVQVADELTAEGLEAIAGVGTVTMASDAEAMVLRAIETWGRLDIVVNNAGVAPNGDRFEDLSESEWTRVVPVHLCGHINVLRAAWPHLQRSDAPRIVNVSSSSVLGMAGATTYATAKGGVIGLTRNLAYECRDTPFRINAVLPFGMTRMTIGDYWQRFDDKFGLPVGTAAARFTGAAAARGVALLCHPEVPCSGELFTVGGGRMSRVIIAATTGVEADSPEEYLDQWDRIFDTGQLSVLADGDSVKRVLLGLPAALTT